jgi:transcriptional regulator with XRE-family HTH domain
VYNTLRKEVCMNNINNRIEILRKTLDLSMEKFGNRIGITRSSVNSIEKGVNNPSEQTIKLVCKEFNVNYFWLTEGMGDMFNAFPETIIDEVVEEFKLNNDDKLLIETYLEMPDESRKEIMNFLKAFAEKVQKKDEE